MPTGLLTYSLQFENFAVEVEGQHTAEEHYYFYVRAKEKLEPSAMIKICHVLKQPPYELCHR
jgi:hypothetical protein